MPLKIKKKVFLDNVFGIFTSIINIKTLNQSKYVLLNIQKNLAI